MNQAIIATNPQVLYTKSDTQTHEFYSFQYGRSTSSVNNADLIIAKQLKANYLDNDFEPTPDLLQQFDQGYSSGDKLCDQWLADASKLPAHGMLVFKKLLSELADNPHKSPSHIPQSLNQLLSSAMQTPYWVDFKLIDIASQAISRYPLQLGLTLQSVSLMGGYSIPGLSEPLLATNALSKSVVPRMARTLAFIASVTIPNGLKNNGIGFRQSLHTRVVHGLVRQHLLQTDTWRGEHFGVPINQTDMIATNMVFSLTVIHGFTALKCKLSDEERLAILHLWRYVGHILGIDDSLMPKSESECNKWLYSYLVTQKIDAKSARPLAKALHELPLEIENYRFKGFAKLEKEVRAGMTRMYWGDDICNDLGLPKAMLGKNAIIALANAQNVVEKTIPYSKTLERSVNMGAEKYRNIIKNKYLLAHPELAELFQDIEASFLAAS